MRYAIIFLSTAAIIAVGGCLPDGDPPEGQIVRNPAENENVINAPSDRKNAVKLAADGLTGVTMLNCPGEKIGIRADRRSAALAAEVLRQCGRISGVQGIFSAGNEKWQLHSVLKDDIWTLKLLCSGQEKYSVKMILPPENSR